MEVEIIKPDNEVIAEKLNAFIELRQQINELTKQLDSQKEELRTYIADGESKLIVGEHSIAIKKCTRTAIDTKALQAAHPKLAEKFIKTTTYETVTIK